MNLNDFLLKAELDAQACETVLNIHALTKNNTSFHRIIRAVDALGDFRTVDKKITQLAAALKIDQYELNLTVLCVSFKEAIRRYQEKGIPEEIFWANSRDLGWKASECEKVYGVWGVFSFEWYKRFLEASRFSLGRLQFEEIFFEFDSYHYKDAEIRRNDIVINIHIPSSGSLTENSVKEALVKAYHFFDRKYNERMFFICSSWLLYPPYKKLFDRNSNLYKFADLFDIIDEASTPDFDDSWRIFNTACKDISSLPRETSLQRAFVQYMTQRLPFGQGVGMLVTEGRI